MLKLWRRSRPRQVPNPARWDVLRALPKSGCPICRVQREWSQRFYFWLVTQDYYGGTMPQKLKQAGGLCRKHADKLLELRSVYTTSVMYEYLVKDAIAKLQVVAEEARRAASQPSRKPPRFSTLPTGECPACADDREVVESTVRELVAGLSDGAIAEKFRAGDALCMPHFHRAVEYATPDIVVLLAQTQIAKLNALTNDFTEYFRKVDYRFANEPKGDEQTAWQRAITRLSGETE